MKLQQKNAQTAIEYLILLSLVAVIVMVSFSHLLPRATNQTNGTVFSLFSRARSSIMGEKVQSINGNWCLWGPCINGEIKRLCDCPAPLGSGRVCPGSSNMTMNCDEGSFNGDSGDSGGEGDSGDGDGGPGGGTSGGDED